MPPSFQPRLPRPPPASALPASFVLASLSCLPARPSLGSRFPVASPRPPPLPWSPSSPFRFPPPFPRPPIGFPCPLWPWSSLPLAAALFLTLPPRTRRWAFPYPLRPGSPRPARAAPAPAPPPPRSPPRARPPPPPARRSPRSPLPPVCLSSPGPLRSRPSPLAGPLRLLLSPFGSAPRFPAPLPPVRRPLSSTPALVASFAAPFPLLPPRFLLSQRCCSFLPSPPAPPASLSPPRRPCLGLAPFFPVFPPPAARLPGPAPLLSGPLLRVIPPASLLPSGSSCPPLALRSPPPAPRSPPCRSVLLRAPLPSSRTSPLRRFSGFCGLPSLSVPLPLVPLLVPLPLQPLISVLPLAFPPCPPHGLRPVPSLPPRFSRFRTVSPAAPVLLAPPVRPCLARRLASPPHASPSPLPLASPSPTSPFFFSLSALLHSPLQPPFASPSPRGRVCFTPHPARLRPVLPCFVVAAGFLPSRFLPPFPSSSGGSLSVVPWRPWQAGFLRPLRPSSLLCPPFPSRSPGPLPPSFRCFRLRPRSWASPPLSFFPRPPLVRRSSLPCLLLSSAPAPLPPCFLAVLTWPSRLFPVSPPPLPRRPLPASCPSFSLPLACVPLLPPRRSPPPSPPLSPCLCLRASFSVALPSLPLCPVLLRLPSLAIRPSPPPYSSSARSSLLLPLLSVLPSVLPPLPLRSRPLFPSLLDPLLPMCLTRECLLVRVLRFYQCPSFFPAPPPRCS